MSVSTKGPWVSIAQFNPILILPAAVRVNSESQTESLMRCFFSESPLTPGRKKKWPICFNVCPGSAQPFTFKTISRFSPSSSKPRWEDYNLRLMEYSKVSKKDCRESDFSFQSREYDSTFTAEYAEAKTSAFFHFIFNRRTAEIAFPNLFQNVLNNMETRTQVVKRCSSSRNVVYFMALMCLKPRTSPGHP